MTTPKLVAADSQIPAVKFDTEATGHAAVDKRARDALAALAHDLRNPLAALTTCIPLLERHPPRDEVETLAREIIQRQILQLRRLTEALAESRADAPARGAAADTTKPPSALPERAEATRSALPAASSADTPNNKRRVLIIEDNPDVQLSLKALLELWGHDVSVASDGHSGLRVIECLRPDVAFIDIELPSVNGYEMARRLTAHPLRRRPYLIAVTGYGAPEQKEQALKSGFDVHLAKPADPDRLAELIRNSPQRSQPV